MTQYRTAKDMWLMFEQLPEDEKIRAVSIFVEHLTEIEQIDLIQKILPKFADAAQLDERIAKQLVAPLEKKLAALKLDALLSCN